jgi:hypothetical protein
VPSGVALGAAKIHENNKYVTKASASVSVTMGKRRGDAAVIFS